MKTEKTSGDLNRVTCPFCASLHTKRLYSVNSEEVLKHLNFDKDDTLIRIIENLWESKTSWFYICEECTFSFAWPFKSANEEFYSAIYSNVKFYPAQKWDYSITRQSIYRLGDSLSLNGTNLLEIGAGNGSFIKSISPALIPKGNILCTEFSDYGKDEILNYGIDCISADLNNLEMLQYINKFDIVCMFQVLEHMDGFDDFFNKLNEITGKNAHLFITVPNHKFREFYDSINFKLDLPPIHVGRWNKATLDALGKKYSWVLKEHKIENPKFLKKLRRFLFNRYYYFSFTRTIDKIGNRPLNLVMKTVVFIYMIIIYFPSVVRLLATEMGVAQWAHLQRY